MPLNDDSADDRLSEARRATPGRADAAESWPLPSTLIWLTGHADHGIDSWTRDAAGRLSLHQCKHSTGSGKTHNFHLLLAKHLLTRADAQRLARRSVFIFLDARNLCFDVDLHPVLEWRTAVDVEPVEQPAAGEPGRLDEVVDLLAASAAATRRLPVMSDGYADKRL